METNKQEEYIYINASAASGDVCGKNGCQFSSKTERRAHKDEISH